MNENVINDLLNINFRLNYLNRKEKYLLPIIKLLPEDIKDKISHEHQIENSYTRNYDFIDIL